MPNTKKIIAAVRSWAKGNEGARKIEVGRGEDGAPYIAMELKTTCLNPSTAVYYPTVVQVVPRQSDSCVLEMDTFWPLFGVKGPPPDETELLALCNVLNRTLPAKVSLIPDIEIGLCDENGPGGYYFFSVCSEIYFFEISEIADEAIEYVMKLHSAAASTAFTAFIGAFCAIPSAEDDGGRRGGLKVAHGVGGHRHPPHHRPK